MPNIAADATVSQPVACSTRVDTSGSPLSGSPSTRSIPDEPQVDDLTQLLGISWQRVSSDDADMGAAIRGWQKFINNRGLNAYLVASQPSVPTPSDFPAKTIDQAPAFYLFNEDLSEARLVANDWDTCIQRLRTAPITFAESSHTLKATDKPWKLHGHEHEQQEENGVKAELPDAGVAGSSAKGCGWEDRGSDIAMDLD
jgi:hypothetical protein